MKLYIGCKGEMSEGVTPYMVGFSKTTVREAMRQDETNPDEWKEDEVGDLCNGCDYITVRPVEIPDSIIMSAIERHRPSLRKVFNVESD